MPTKARDAFRTISEVADWLDVPAHVLRFWESKFSQIKPVKRAGGRRYYRPDDMELIGGIKRLLHDDGMTIRGVQKMLKEDGIKAVAALSPSLDTVDDAASPRTQQRKAATPAVEDAQVTEETAATEDPVTATPEEEETIAEWEADSAEDKPADEPAVERPPLNISTPDPVEPAQTAAEDETVEEEIAEAPFIEVEEEPEQLGGDNVVNLSGRTEPASDPAAVVEPQDEVVEALSEPELALDAEAETAQDDISAEPELIEEPDVEVEEPPAVAARETTLPPTELTPEPVVETPPVQLDPNREKTLPPTVIPAPAAQEAPAEPDPEPEDTQEGFKLAPEQAKALALKGLLRRTDPSKLDADPALTTQLTRLRALRERLASAQNG